jgi:large subunit ribosomal protein L9
MKIIIAKDTENVGKVGDVVEVSNGFARNFLLPQKIAVSFTKENLAHLQNRKMIIANKEKKAFGELEIVAKKLDGLKIIIKKESGEEGRIFGTITSADIVSSIEDSTGIKIDKRKVQLDEHIKSEGVYEISIRLAEALIPKVIVNVQGNKVLS